MCSKGTARLKLELHLLPFEPRHGIEQTGVMSRIIINSITSGQYSQSSNSSQNRISLIESYM